MNRIICRQIPATPLTIQGASELIIGLTGLCV